MTETHKVLINPYITRFPYSLHCKAQVKDGKVTGLTIKRNKLK